jgi:hypothetical protein
VAVGAALSPAQCRKVLRDVEPLEVHTGVTHQDDSGWEKVLKDADAEGGGAERRSTVKWIPKGDPKFQWLHEKVHGERLSHFPVFD